MALTIDIRNKKQFDAFKHYFRKNEVLGLVLEDFEPMISVRDLNSFQNAIAAYVNSNPGSYGVSVHEEDGNKGLFLSKIR